MIVVFANEKGGDQELGSTSIPVFPRKDYDYSRSTEDNYAAVLAEDGAYVGDFVGHRQTLDYTYHKRYSAARQLFQDEIVRHFLLTVVRDAETNMFCERPKAPWVVFTAGAMGAGKSHAMRWMAEQGHFPLASFVQVDPDMIRYRLPEMAGYLSRNQDEAGSLTHKEAGFIQEILTLEGLKRGKNVIVDGSLRNAEWNKVFFSRIRAEYPEVRLAIIHVVCSAENVLARAARRAEKTGRVVPPRVLLRALEDVPRAVAELGPLVDYAAEVNTDRAVPELRQPEGEDWHNFAEQWAQQCKVEESFPAISLLKSFNNSEECEDSVEAIGPNGFHRIYGRAVFERASSVSPPRDRMLSPHSRGALANSCPDIAAILKRPPADERPDVESVRSQRSVDPGAPRAVVSPLAFANALQGAATL
eukprot:CAMPEP_0172634592 /NCGR_PEP_ID=MMETSP1068-20121228/195376_1 /TAXON_ID=35684 /ORGANISM="Pseudopedinella elastica, Strain CCMP716" /LENGTH=416 /DNA_ID=CAMNT_0013446567 /DNA_START=209 /DNA_END=1459 /DNA_ORIENTATION=+